MLSLFLMLTIALLLIRSVSKSKTVNLPLPDRNSTTAALISISSSAGMEPALYKTLLIFLMITSLVKSPRYVGGTIIADSNWGCVIYILITPASP